MKTLTKKPLQAGTLLALVLASTFLALASASYTVEPSMQVRYNFAYSNDFTMQSLAGSHTVSTAPLLDNAAGFTTQYGVTATGLQRHTAPALAYNTTNVTVPGTSNETQHPHDAVLVPVGQDITWTANASFQTALMNQSVSNITMEHGAVVATTGQPGNYSITGTRERYGSDGWVPRNIYVHSIGLTYTRYPDVWYVSTLNYLQTRDATDQMGLGYRFTTTTSYSWYAETKMDYIFNVNPGEFQSLLFPNVTRIVAVEFYRVYVVSRLKIWNFATSQWTTLTTASGVKFPGTHVLFNTSVSHLNLTNPENYINDGEVRLQTHDELGADGETPSIAIVRFHQDYLICQQAAERARGELVFTSPYLNNASTDLLVGFQTNANETGWRVPDELNNTAFQNTWSTAGTYSFNVSTNFTGGELRVLFDSWRDHSLAITITDATVATMLLLPCTVNLTVTHSGGTEELAMRLVNATGVSNTTVNATFDATSAALSLRSGVLSVSAQNVTLNWTTIQVVSVNVTAGFGYTVMAIATPSVQSLTVNGRAMADTGINSAFVAFDTFQTALAFSYTGDLYAAFTVASDTYFQNALERVSHTYIQDTFRLSVSGGMTLQSIQILGVENIVGVYMDGTLVSTTSTATVNTWITANRAVHVSVVLSDPVYEKATALEQHAASPLIASFHVVTAQQAGTYSPGTISHALPAGFTNVATRLVFDTVLSTTYNQDDFTAWAVSKNNESTSNLTAGAWSVVADEQTSTLAPTWANLTRNGTTTGVYTQAGNTINTLDDATVNASVLENVNSSHYTYVETDPSITSLIPAWDAIAGGYDGRERVYNTSSTTTNTYTYPAAVAAPHVVEMWLHINVTKTGAANADLMMLLNNVATIYITTGWGVDNQLRFDSTGYTLPVATWFHFRVSSTASASSFYVNGALVGSRTWYPTGSPITTMGWYVNGENNRAGFHIADLCVVGVNDYEQGDNIAGLKRVYSHNTNVTSHVIPNATQALGGDDFTGYSPAATTTLEDFSHLDACTDFNVNDSIRGAGGWDNWTTATNCSFTLVEDGGRLAGRLIDANSSAGITSTLTFTSSKTLSTTADWIEFTMTPVSGSGTNHEYSPRFTVLRGATNIIRCAISDDRVHNVEDGTIRTLYSVTIGREYRVRITWASNNTHTMTLWENNVQITSTTYTNYSNSTWSGGAVTAVSLLTPSSVVLNTTLNAIRASWLTAPAFPAGDNVRDRNASSGLGTWDAWTEVEGCSFTAALAGGEIVGHLVDANDTDRITPYLAIPAHDFTVGEFVEHTWTFLSATGGGYPFMRWQSTTSVLMGTQQYSTGLVRCYNAMGATDITTLTIGDTITVRFTYASDTTHVVTYSVNAGAWATVGTITNAGTRAFSSYSINQLMIYSSASGAGGGTSECYIGPIRYSWSVPIRNTTASDGASTWDAWSTAAGCGFITYEDGRQWGRLVDASAAATFNPTLTFGSAQPDAGSGWYEYTLHPITLPGGTYYWRTGAQTGSSNRILEYVFYDGRYAVLDDWGLAYVLPAGSIVAGTTYVIRIEFITSSTFDVLIDGVRYDNSGSHYTTVSGRTGALTRLRPGSDVVGSTSDMLITDIRASWLLEVPVPDAPGWEFSSVSGSTANVTMDRVLVGTHSIALNYVNTSHINCIADNYINVRDPGAYNAYLYFSTSGDDGYSIFTLQTETGAGYAIAGGVRFLDTSGTRLIQIPNHGGTYTTVAGHTWEYGEWLHVRFAFDWDAAIYAVYIDDVAVTTTATTSNWGLLSRVRYMTSYGGTTPGYTQAIYVDNVTLEIARHRAAWFTPTGEAADIDVRVTLSRTVPTQPVFLTLNGTLYTIYASTTYSFTSVVELAITFWVVLDNLTIEIDVDSVVVLQYVNVSRTFTVTGAGSLMLDRNCTATGAVSFLANGVAIPAGDQVNLTALVGVVATVEIVLALVGNTSSLTFHEFHLWDNASIWVNGAPLSTTLVHTDLVAWNDTTFTITRTYSRAFNLTIATNAIWNVTSDRWFYNTTFTLGAGNATLLPARITLARTSHDDTGTTRFYMNDTEQASYSEAYLNVATLDITITDGTWFNVKLVATTSIVDLVQLSEVVYLTSTNVLYETWFTIDAYRYQYVEMPATLDIASATFTIDGVAVSATRDGNFWYLSHAAAATVLLRGVFVIDPEFTTSQEPVFNNGTAAIHDVTITSSIHVENLTANVNLTSWQIYMAAWTCDAGFDVLQHENRVLSCNITRHEAGTTTYRFRGTSPAPVATLASYSVETGLAIATTTSSTFRAYLTYTTYSLAWRVDPTITPAGATLNGVWLAGTVHDVDAAGVWFCSGWGTSISQSYVEFTATPVTSVTQARSGDTITISVVAVLPMRQATYTLVVDDPRRVVFTSTNYTWFQLTDNTFLVTMLDLDIGTNVFVFQIRTIDPVENTLYILPVLAIVAGVVVWYLHRNGQLARAWAAITAWFGRTTTARRARQRSPTTRRDT